MRYFYATGKEQLAFGAFFHKVVTYEKSIDLAGITVIGIRGWNSGRYGLTRFKFDYLDSSVAAQQKDQQAVPDIGTIGFAVFKSRAGVQAATRGKAFIDL